MASITTHTVLKSLLATHHLNYATHQMENLQLLSEETTLNFQYWDVSSCNTLFQWTELELPAGLSPSTQGTDNPA